MGAGKDAAVGALGGHQVAGIDEGRVGGVGGAQADGAGAAGVEEGGADDEACGAGLAGGKRGTVVLVCSPLQRAGPPAAARRHGEADGAAGRPERERRVIDSKHGPFKRGERKG